MDTWLLTLYTVQIVHFLHGTGYDYPGYCFGQDGEGNHVFFVGAYFDIVPSEYPEYPKNRRNSIHGLGEIGTGTYIIINKLLIHSNIAICPFLLKEKRIMASTNMTVNSLSYNTSGLFSDVILTERKLGH